MTSSLQTSSKGPVETLPTVIFSAVKQGIKPNIMAISTLLLAVSVICRLSILSRMGKVKPDQQNKEIRMELIKLGVAALTSMAANIATAEGKLSIYHWFEYIPQELLDKFSAEYDVEVTMDAFDSNEAMLASLKAGKMNL